MDEQKSAGCGCLIGLILVVVLMVTTGGQWRTDVTLTPPLSGANVTNVVDFEEELNAKHWVGGFVKGDQPDVQAAVNKHVGEGKQLTKLTVQTRHSGLDYLVTAVTVGIYCPVTVTVKGSAGQVVKPVDKPTPVVNETQPPPSKPGSKSRGR